MVAQRLERWLVKPRAEGSNPFHCAMYKFYDSHHKNRRCLFYLDHLKVVPANKYNVYSREDIENLAKVLSPSLGKRLLGLKPGNSLKLHYLHRCGDMMVYHFTEEEIQKEKEIISIVEELQVVRKKIYEQTVDLQLQQRELEKKLKKLR